ncbi:MAG: hypothetical protein IKF37_00780 [Bacilli bacterium]|nr:hypothetical protein [Bacilli bacterium]
MQKKDNKNKKLRVIVWIYRFVCIALIGTLVFCLKVNADKKNPIIIRQEIINPNIVMLGDSITDFYDLDKYYGSEELIVNSGISGNRTQDIINDIRNRVYDYNPSELFLLIGVNDIIYDNAAPEDVIQKIDTIVLEIKEKLPNTKIYIESIYPVNNTWRDEHDNRVRDEKEINGSIIMTNDLIKEYCEENNLKYIDLYPHLLDDNGVLNHNYSDDGLHPNDKGYEVITKILKKYM